MPVRIPSLDPPVAWAMLVVGYLLYVIACSCASVEKNGSDSNVRSDDVQIGSLADDIVEGEEQLMGGEAALDENETDGNDFLWHSIARTVVGSIYFM